MQLLNIYLKQKLKTIGMTELGKSGKYFDIKY